MATGESLLSFGPLNNEPPGANYATLDLRNSHPTLDFDAAVDESAIFSGVLPRNYAGNGITVTLIVTATSATSGTSRWHTQFERNDTGTDLDTDSFDATGVTSGTSAPATSGAPAYIAHAHANGARLDNLAAGEKFRLKVTRDADGTSGTDDLIGDTELLGIELKET